MTGKALLLRRGLTVLCAVAALMGILAPPAAAQSAAGTLVGRAVDDSGAGLPGVTVTATNTDTGSSRLTVTAEDGSYRFAALPAGPYKVVTELAGFSTVTVEGVAISVASERDLSITLKPAAVEESITVVDEAPLVANTPSIGAVISQQELENLPLNGRQFANLAVLAPGTTLGYNTDPTKPGQLVVQLNGGFGRNVNYVVDGGDNTDDTIGGALQNFPLESVQEFKIQTQQYKAEYGRTTGGVLSVVTKTGTNEFQGSAYGFFRDKSLNTASETEKLSGAGKQPYKRRQYGASVGGPIVKDKAHFFATYEKTKRDTAYTINTAGTLPNLDGQSVVVPFEDELGQAKLSWDLTAKQFLQVRYGYQKNTDKYGQNPLAAPSSLGTVTNDYKSILIGHTSQFGADALNEAVFQYTKFQNTISADSNDPFLYFPSGVTVGQNINTPQSTNQTKYQYKDEFSFSRTLGGHRHDFKTGASYVNEPTLGGDFTTGTSGQFSLLSDALGINSPVTDITINGGFSGNKTPVKQYGAFFQDDWAVNNNLTVNIGLRYDYNDGFDLDQRSSQLWQTLSTQTTFNESYLREFQGGRGGKLSNDTNNWAPRLGFTWDVNGNGKHLLRGGVGRYYDFPYTNATILFPALAVQSAGFGAVYNANNPNGLRNADGSFYRVGQPLPPNQLPGAAIPPENDVASPTLATPYSDQISLGYSLQANDWLGFNFEAVSVKYEDIPFRFRANPRTATGARRFPAFNNFRIWTGGGTAEYRGANIGFRARDPKGKFEFQGFYTYSKADGLVLGGADEFRLTVVDHQPDLASGRDVSFNPLDPFCGACDGPLITDARHRFTIGGTYRGPWGINVAGTFRYRSALPYSDIVANDPNHDGFRLDLAPGATPNGRRGAAFKQLDVRVAKEFTFGGHYGVELIAEVFNLTNSKNPAGFNGTRGTATFGQATKFAGDPGQGEQRLAQLGLRLKF
jgi:hypothetical protein